MYNQRCERCGHYHDCHDRATGMCLDIGDDPFINPFCTCEGFIEPQAGDLRDEQFTHGAIPQ